MSMSYENRAGFIKTGIDGCGVEIYNMRACPFFQNEADTITFIRNKISGVARAVSDSSPAAKKIPGFSRTESAWAEVIIQILNNCTYRGYRVGEAVVAQLDIYREEGRK